jgi:ATP-dependent Lon protease
MIPEILKDIGQENNIFFSDEILIYLIEKYTCEPGVRKLKELLNIIIGEINLEILKLENEDIELPYFVSKEEIKNKFLKKKREAKIMTIHDEPKVGIINGLWANAMGRGGIIPIQVSFFPSNTFMELKLTGMQGDVMKESMNVSKTMAWNLTPREAQERLIKYFDATKNQGIHIHCPEGAVPKDGPSAGTAITIAIYSLLNDKKIRNDFAITGEINLQGNVTIIGGLDLKILGGINAGIKKFLFPTENLFDFNLFMEKYKNNKILENIEFLDVNHVDDALSCFLV